MQKAYRITLMIIWLLYAPIAVSAVETDVTKALPDPACIEDWPMDGKVVLFDKDTLFDHINGESELYFPYGFEALGFARYANRNNPKSAFDADIYKMGSLLDAFGMYANYRRKDDVDVNVGAEGTASPSQLLFYQDRYFVRIQVTGATSLAQDLFIACGRAVSRNLPPNKGRPGELEILAGIPGVVTKSERYLAQSLIGYAFFRRGMIADVILGGEPVQVFVVFENSTDAARKAFDDYRSYLKTEGKEMSVIKAIDRISLTAVDPLYRGVFVEQSGPYLIGAIRMNEASAAKPIVEQLRERLLKR